MKSRFWLGVIALIGLATCAIPGLPQSASLPNSTTSSLNALNAVAVGPNTSNGGTCMADISGTWSGTITFQIKGQGNNAVAAQAYTFGGGVQGSTTASNGSYYWPASGTMLCQATMTGFSSGPAIVTISVSAADAAIPGVVSSIGPVTLVTPVTVNCGATPCSVTTPAPAATNAADLGINVHIAGSTAQPLAVTTPSSAPLPTASAGVAPPANAVQISDFPACEYAGGLAVLTGQNFVTQQCDLTGRLYVNIGDPTQSFASSGAISSATTTVLKVGIATKQTYIYLATWESTGTNSGNTVQWEYSTNASCASGNTTILPAAIAPGTATGEWTTVWGNQAVSNTTVNGLPGPANLPLVLPAGNTFCGVTAGTTTAGTFITVYGIH